jgi:hypothetical protein
VLEEFDHQARRATYRCFSIEVKQRKALSHLNTRTPSFGGAPNVRLSPIPDSVFVGPHCNLTVPIISSHARAGNCHRIACMNDR